MQMWVVIYHSKNSKQLCLIQSQQGLSLTESWNRFAMFLLYVIMVEQTETAITVTEHSINFAD